MNKGHAKLLFYCTASACVFVLLHTCEDPHGSMHSIDVSTDQHLHQLVEQLRPGLRPVPVCNGWHGVSDAGADLADRLAQAAWQQLPDGCFSLGGVDKIRLRNMSEKYFLETILLQVPDKTKVVNLHLVCSFRRSELLWLGTPVSLHILLQNDRR